MFGRSTYMHQYADMVRINKERGYNITGNTLICIEFESNGMYKDKQYLENNIETIAAFICKNEKDKIILTQEDYCVITTIGSMVDLCCDNIYIKKLLPVLLNRQYNNKA